MRPAGSRWLGGAIAVLSLGCLFVRPAPAAPLASVIAAARAKEIPLAELVPERCRFFMQIDADALRRAGPSDAVGRLQRSVAPALREMGLSVEQLRGAVMAVSLDSARGMSGDRLPTWLLLQQNGEPPAPEKLKAAFQHYTRGPWRTARTLGVAYQTSRDVSLMQLPGGPMLVTGTGSGATAAIEPVLALFQGRGRGKAGPVGFVRGARAALLRAAQGQKSEAKPDAQPDGQPEALPTLTPAISLWLELDREMQKSLLGDAHAPAAPSEIAGALRLSGGAGELFVLARTGSRAAPGDADSDGEGDGARALAGWVTERLQAAAQRPEAVMLGLAGYLQAAKVTSDKNVVTVRLPLSEPEYAGLLERLSGLLATVGPRPGAAPTPASPHSSSHPAAKSSSRRRARPKESAAAAAPSAPVKSRSAGASARPRR